MRSDHTMITQRLISNQHHNMITSFNEKEWNEFREAHPELRFWQALRAFMYVDKIVLEWPEDEEIVRQDTFYIQDDK